VRIFAGTIVELEFFKNLEFCDALVFFCKNRSYQQLGVKEFCQFVRNNRKLWPNLDKWLVGRGKLQPASKVKQPA